MPEIVIETVFPISFYIRAASDGGTEIVALSRGDQRVYRLNELQLIHLACDATLQMTKRALAVHSAAKRGDK